jgi:predicted small secreted protein
MRSKKTFSIVLSGLITFGLSSPVYAQEGNMKSISSTSAIVVNDTIDQNNSKISKDEAKNIAKKVLSDYFEMTIDETQYQTNVNFRPNYSQLANGKDYVWDIYWSYNHEDKNMNINVSVDASTGKVINANIRSFNNGKTSGIAILTEDKAF